MSGDAGTVVVLGGGGHAKVLISVLRKLPWTIAGYVDPRDVGPVLGVPHAGDDDVLPALLARHPGCAAAMGVGKVDASARRARIHAAAEALGYGYPTFVSPDAVVNAEVELGAGTAVFDGAVVNAGRRCRETGGAQVPGHAPAHDRAAPGVDHDRDVREAARSRRT